MGWEWLLRVVIREVRDGKSVVMKLAVMVVGRAWPVVGCAHGQYQSKCQARKMVREAQARANEERAQRDRDNVDDMATFWSHARGWPGVDEWQAERVAQIGREADRRREEHCGDAAAGLAPIGGCGAESGALVQVAEDLADRTQISLRPVRET